MELIMQAQAKITTKLCAKPVALKGHGKELAELWNG